MADGTLREIAEDGFFDIRLIAFTIAIYGSYGEGCFATAETVARLMGCKRKTVERYRAQLIQLGWFAEVSREGGFNNRGLVLSIAIPGDGNGEAAAQTLSPR